MSSPSQHSPVLGPGAASLGRGDYAAVITECTEALKADPRCADAYCNRARARRALADLEGAIADATEALRLDPSHAWAHRTLGDVYLLRGNLEAAVDCCDEAIRLDPFLASAYNTRAGARLLQKDLYAARLDSDRAIRLNPALWGAYITRGNVRYHQGDPNADEDYRTAFDLNPAGYTRSVMQIIAEQVRYELDLLFSNCAEHLRQNPRDTTSYSRRGLALLLLGKDAEAQPDFDQILLLKPEAKDRLEKLIAEAKRLRGG